MVTAGTFTFTLSLADVSSNPAPIVWRDQTGQIAGFPRKRWEDRFKIDEAGYSDLYWGRLTDGTDYTFASNQIQNVALNEHDRIYVEYSHDLTNKPGILKRLSIHITVYDALLAVMGQRQARVSPWREDYEVARRDLELIRNGELGIAEFDDLKLFDDYTENLKTHKSVKMVKWSRV